MISFLLSLFASPTTSIASLVASPLAKLALAVLLLAAGAGGGWWMKSKVDAPTIADLAAQVQVERGVNQLLQVDQNRTRASVAALQAQAEECMQREAKYGSLYAKASAALDKARAGKCDNATDGHAGHGDLIRILNEASAGRWDE